MPTRASDVMQRSVISVGPDTPLIDVHRLFVEEQIHGAPVLDDTGKILGVVSSTDLLRAVEEEQDAAAYSSDYLRDLLEFSAPDWGGSPEDFQDRLGQTTVADVMTPGAVTIPPDTPVAEIASTLRTARIHRVWVAENGQLVGVVSTFDLLPLLEKTAL